MKAIMSEHYQDATQILIDRAKGGDRTAFDELIENVPASPSRHDSELGALSGRSAARRRGSAPGVLHPRLPVHREFRVDARRRVLSLALRDREARSGPGRSGSPKVEREADHCELRRSSEPWPDTEPSVAA